MAINRSFDESYTEYAERIEFNQEYSFRPGRHLRKRKGVIKWHLLGKF